MIEEAEEEKNETASRPPSSDGLMHNIEAAFKHIIDAKLKEEKAGFTLRVLRA